MKDMSGPKTRHRVFIFYAQFHVFPFYHATLEHNYHTKINKIMKNRVYEPPDTSYILIKI